MPAGQPPKYDSPEQLQAKSDEYFNYIIGEYTMEPNEFTGLMEKVYSRQPEPATISGLCYFLGFETRQSFHDYGKRKKFSYTIRMIRMRIEYAYEVLMNTSKNPTAQMFALKNLGWQDKTQTELSGLDGKPIEQKQTLTVNVVTGSKLPARSELDIQAEIENELKG